MQYIVSVTDINIEICLYIVLCTMLYIVTDINIEIDPLFVKSIFYLL